MRQLCLFPKVATMRDHGEKKTSGACLGGPEKLRALNLISAGVKTPAATASELRVHRSQIYRWQKLVLEKGPGALLAQVMGRPPALSQQERQRIAESIARTSPRLRFKDSPHLRHQVDEWTLKLIQEVVLQQYGKSVNKNIAMELRRLGRKVNAYLEARSAKRPPSNHSTRLWYAFPKAQRVKKSSDVG